MSPGPPRRQPDERRGEAAARTAGEAEGKPRTKAGAGSPKGNTGRRAAGCGPSLPSQEGLEEGDGDGLAAAAKDRMTRKQIPED